MRIGEVVGVPRREVIPENNEDKPGFMKCKLLGLQYIKDNFFDKHSHKTSKPDLAEDQTKQIIMFPIEM